MNPGRCKHLALHLSPCEQHRDEPWSCPDVLFVRTATGYGLPVRDGGDSWIEITHCPFCGEPLAGEVDPDALHREAFDLANPHDPVSAPCSGCGQPAICCICGDGACPACNCDPCDCDRDEDDYP